VAGRHPEDVETTSEEIDETEATEEVEAGERSERVVEYWAALGIDPVEVSFPRGGTGLTLRQYRIAADLGLNEEDDEDEDSEDEVTDASEGDTTKAAETAEGIDSAEDVVEEEDADETESRTRRPGVAAGEEEAFFLATEGILHMFRTPESLVEFVQTNTDHDLADAENWDELVATLTPDLLVADEEDTYELDLVVDNLRGGHDVWERDLIVGAGEFARDAAYALDLAEVDAVLAPDSPLDALDEGIRANGFFARRKLRKISAEQAALAWRSVIGRISSSVEWH
jgi:hypothetical protein